MAEPKRREVSKEESERRRRKVGRGGEEPPPLPSPARDPLVVLGPDIMGRILEFSDARSVARSVVLSRGWHEVATSDSLWGPKCEELWMGKAHIPRVSKIRGAARLAVYSMSIMDGKRARITKEDLCDHMWEYRFKKTAPEYWRNLDPSWKGTGPPMRRHFHPDGFHTADRDDRVWGGHECTFLIMTSHVGDGRIREHYVRINRWPPMTMSRNEDWSWEMSNQLCCYNSIPDAEKEGGTGPLFPVW
ncbi:uncharacterized protein [Typha latifolia]|uniref:uncharacterized protein n=1 Tax=Typha latifolia TaxID=4733 RepID=UPI003C30B3CE